jgi:acetyltransferase-like isoleucine patch superfamily enzyme
VRLVRLLLAAVDAGAAELSLLFWSGVARFRLSLHGARVGKGLRVRGPLRLHCHRTGSISIGESCRIQSGFAGNPVGGSRMAIWVGPAGRLRLGDRVGLSNSTIVCMNEVTIADEVFLGGDTKVYDTDFHSTSAAQRSQPGNPGVRTAPVTIHDRVFVGGHSILLKGTVVGKGAVLGAGSVVRSRIPEMELWAGNPARFVRSLRTSGPRPLEAVQ